ncbi:MAG: hypothetical protein NUV42_00755 [Candidatus Yonathbacteria bacterium]|nr:hypothetical protein [Candidatus Yonathbacteria bacterium]
MTKTQFLITMGFIVAIMPFLGFPGGVKDTIIAVLGIAIAFVSFLLGRRAKQDDRNSFTPDEAGAFIDNEHKFYHKRGTDQTEDTISEENTKAD